MPEEIRGQRNLVQIGEDAVTKVAVGHEASRPKRLRVEAFALQKAFEYGLSVPKVTSYGINSDGDEYIVMQKVDGINAASANLETPLERVYQIAGEQFARIPAGHDTFGWISPEDLTGENRSWAGHISQHITKYAGRLRDAGELDSTEANNIISLVNKNVPDVQNASLVHRDLKPLNLIVKGENVAILDWENVMFGDPLYDLGVLTSKFPDDERIIRGFRMGLLNNRYDQDQRRVVTMYGLVDLVGAICFYRGKAPRELYTRLRDTIKQLESPPPTGRSISSGQ